MNESARVIARGDGADGELALRVRAGDDGDVYELIVNGVFTMDTAETSTEELLADIVLQRHSSPSHVLVGGLGFAFTASRLLDDARVEQIDVVELEELLVDWLRAGLVPPVKKVLEDPRLDLIVANLRDVVTSASSHIYDALLLDVDNGPEFLLHPANAALYQDEFLAECDRILKPGGVLAIWLAAPSPALLNTMAKLFGNVDDMRRTVEREGRFVDYHVYLASTRTPELP
jgi:spermidine synthase